MSYGKPFAAFVLAALLAVPAVRAENESVERARSLFEATDFSRAIAELKNVPANDAMSLALLGRCYLLEGQYAEAVTTLEKAAALRPNDSQLLTWLARAYGHRAETASALTALRFANKTHETFEQAVALDPSNTEALNDLFEFYVKAPGIAGGGSDKALALLPQIRRYDPVGFELAEALIAETGHHFEKAEGHLRKAIRMAPEKPALYSDLARFLARRGRHQESDALFAEARAVAPGSPRIDYERAETWLKFGRNSDEAKELLRRYAASTGLTPTDPPRSAALRLLRKAEGA